MKDGHKFTAVKKVDESLQLAEVAGQAVDADVVVKMAADSGSRNRRRFVNGGRQRAAKPQHAATHRRRARVK